MRKTNSILLGTFFILYAVTFLPNIGILNDLSFWGPFPEPLALTLIINAINTIIIFVIYFKVFKPFALRMEKRLSEEGEIK
jgi:quinol-cytochrome oxidoreductase complex cytochrome b subunit